MSSNAAEKQRSTRSTRSSGVQEFRSSGVQEFRSSGVQEFSLGCLAKFQAESGIGISIRKYQEANLGWARRRCAIPRAKALGCSL